ncbi:MAG: hypothetical protein AB7U73_07250 [Pirellulales bacterium]
MSSLLQGVVARRYIWLGLTLLAAGCGGSKSPADVSKADWAKANGSGKPAPVGQAIEVVDVAKLKPLGDRLAPLDDGRLTLAPPAAWVFGPRSSERLAMFQLEPDDPYPAIILTAVDVQATASLSPENIAGFAAELQAQLDEELAAKNLALAEPVKVVQIGDFLGVEYTRTAKAKDTRLERCFLETVQAGRRYQLEMRTRAGSLFRFRPYIYAVAAGMKFGPESAAPSGEETTESEPDAPTEPAEPKPSDEAAP